MMINLPWGVLAVWIAAQLVYLLVQLARGVMAFVRAWRAEWRDADDVDDQADTINFAREWFTP